MVDFHPRQVNLQHVFWFGMLAAITFFVGLYIADALSLSFQDRQGVIVHAVGVTGSSIELVSIGVTVKQSEGGVGSLYASLSPTQSFSPDFQSSAVNAYFAAKKLLPEELKGKDVFIRASSSYSELGGNSGGAVLGVGIIAAVTGSTIKGDYYMSASIDSEGHTGPVAYVGEKAIFLDQLGAKALLVSDNEPALSARDPFLVPVSDLRDAACLMLEGPALERLECQ